MLLIAAFRIWWADPATSFLKAISTAARRRELKKAFRR